jgi:hypothetical protein
MLPTSTAVMPSYLTMGADAVLVCEVCNKIWCGKPNSLECCELLLRVVGRSCSITNVVPQRTCLVAIA